MDIRISVLQTETIKRGCGAPFASYEKALMRMIATRLADASHGKGFSPAIPRRAFFWLRQPF
jgi:hypothetical protein